MVVLVFVTFLSTSYSQDKPDIKVRVGGTVQAMVSSAQTNTDTSQVGFGLKRIRGRLYTTFSKNIKGFIQFEMTSFKLLDARIEFIINKAAQFRVGRFKVAGVRAGGLTSHTKIDIVERSVSAQKWGLMTIGADYRDFGVAFLGTSNGFSYNLTLHNGNGAVNLKASQKTTASVQNTSFAFSGMTSYKPQKVKGLELGGHYGVGNSTFNDYNAYSAYLYYEPGSFRFKGEYIGVKNKNGPFDITTAGYYFFGAYKVAKNVELLGRWERYDKNTDVSNDAETFTTFGFAYSFFSSKWTATKITAAYVIRSEDGVSVNNNVFYVMFQLVF
ncbi:MAG: hypothetical protein IIA48_01615 [Bacteroidetes bacterium]|nr:hypothetical protein [Bacteroidota bacterium]